MAQFSIKSVIVSLPFKIIASVGAVIIIAAVIWAAVGKRPAKVEDNNSIQANGIIAYERDVSTVAAEKDGIVSDVLVSEGDKVSVGQEIARLDSDEAQKQIDELQKRRDGVDKVTFFSENDVATDDNKELLDIKAQWSAGVSELNKNKTLLQTKEKELEEQKKKTSEAKDALDKAKKAADAADTPTETVDTTALIKAYDDARSELQTARQDQESAESALALAQDKLDALLKELEPYEDELGDAKNALSEAQATAMSAESHMKDMESDMRAAKSNWESAVFAFQNAGPNEDRPALAAAADAAKSSYDNAYDFYTDAQRAYDTAASMVKDAQDRVDECQKPVDDLEPKIAKAREELASAREQAEKCNESLSTAQTNYENARKALSEANGADDTAFKQKLYEDACSDYQITKQKKESAESALALAQDKLDALLKELEPYEDELGDAKNALSEAQATAMSAESHMKDMESDMRAAKSNWESAVFAFQNAGPNEDRPALAAAADAAKSSYDNAYDFYTDAQRAYDTAASMVKEAQDKVDACQKQLDDIDSKIKEAKIELANAQDLSAAWRDRLTDAQTERDGAEKEYEDAKQAEAQRQSDKERADAEYQAALKAYNTEADKISSIQDSVNQLKTQIANEETDLEKLKPDLILKFDTARDAVLAQMDQEIDKCEQMLEDSVLCSTENGFISEINIAKGDTVQQGSVVCSVASDANVEKKVICYVPVEEARKLTAGMRVEVCPSSVDKQKYGYMEGTIQDVAQSVTSQEEIRNQLGNNELAEKVINEGSVVAVTVVLRTDSNTVSGYWWSDKKGAEVAIDDQTIITAEFEI